LKKSWKEDARHRVIFGLILSNIAKQEGLKPLDEALSNEIEKILKNYGPEDLKKIDKKELEGYIYGQLQNEMVFNLLENNS
ncbi:hypothetical protein HYS99_01560, partial [Candidatus Giovannonibacteria bacterium]|nr:hypothetical protein [Candidatus Giovannonibacteria bacterium]